jgi:heme/copper-type cytochrome/quinol oxidase subunit 2
MKHIQNNTLVIISVSAASIPHFLAAQTEDIQSVFGIFLSILTALIPVIIGLALLYFFWGLAQYMLKVGDKTKQEEARNVMVWGVIIIFVMVSIWGLVGLLSATFNFNNDIPDLPQIENSVDPCFTGWCI